MRVALYNDDREELRQFKEFLEECGRETLMQVQVEAFDQYMDFCRTIRDGTEPFDLFVIAQDGTLSLEVMDMVRACYPDTDVFWFSNLDFAVRSYYYRTLWFGRKPVSLEDMKKAFRRKANLKGTKDFYKSLKSNGGLK